MYFSIENFFFVEDISLALVQRHKTKKYYMIDDNGLRNVELIRHQIQNEYQFLHFLSHKKINWLCVYAFNAVELRKYYNGYDAVDFIKMTSCTHAIEKCL